MDFSDDRFKKLCGIRAFPASVVIGEMSSDVTKRRRTEQGVDYGMNQSIGIGMALNPWRTGNRHAA